MVFWRSFREEDQKCRAVVKNFATVYEIEKHHRNMTLKLGSLDK